MHEELLCICHPARHDQKSSHFGISRSFDALGIKVVDEPDFRTKLRLTEYLLRPARLVKKSVLAYDFCTLNF